MNTYEDGRQYTSPETRCRLQEIDDVVDERGERADTIKTDASNGKSNADGLERFLTFQ